MVRVILLTLCDWIGLYRLKMATDPMHIKYEDIYIIICTIVKCRQQLCHIPLAFLVELYRTNLYLYSVSY